jgi:hypothetical protein
MLSERKAVGEQALSALNGCDKSVQRLKTRYRLTIRVIGMQAQAEVGVRKVLRLRH